MAASVQWPRCRGEGGPGTTGSPSVASGLGLCAPELSGQGN